MKDKCFFDDCRSQDVFHSLLSAKNDEIPALKIRCQNIVQKVMKLEASIDVADSYERRDTIILSGTIPVTSTTGDNCSQVVRNVSRVNSTFNWVLKK